MKDFLALVLILLTYYNPLTSILVIPGGIQCPPGYVRRPGSLSCYKFYWKEVGLGVDWNYAQNQCQNDDKYGNLVIIDDPGEYEFIQFLWPTCQGDECTKQYFWVGARNNNKWQWIDESAFPVVPWDVGYPLIDGDCVGVVYKNNLVLFINSPCFAPFHFICEVDITPDPCLPKVIKPPPPSYLNKRDVSPAQYNGPPRVQYNALPPVQYNAPPPAKYIQPAPQYSPVDDPLPPPPPPPPRPRGFIFTSTLYLEHPFYANKFIYCSTENGRLIKNCPPNLYWNNALLRCAARPFGKDLPPPPLSPIPPINPLLLNILSQRLGK